MSDFIAVHGGTVSSIVLALFIINVCLSAFKVILEKLEPSPEQLAASKSYVMVSKVIAIVQNVIDWLSANKQH